MEGSALRREEVDDGLQGIYLPHYINNNPSHVFDLGRQRCAYSIIRRSAEMSHGVDILGRACRMLPISNIEFLSSAKNQPVIRKLFQFCTKLIAIKVR
jgi:hypothetical protein